MEVPHKATLRDSIDVMLFITMSYTTTAMITITATTITTAATAPTAIPTMAPVERPADHNNAQQRYHYRVVRCVAIVYM